MESEHRIISYPERFVRILPLPQWLAWVIIWQLVFLVDYVWTWDTKVTTYSLVFAGIAIFFSVVCGAIIYCTRVLERFGNQLPKLIALNEAEVNSWYNRKMNRSYSGFLPLLAGILISAGAMVSLYQLITQMTPDVPGLLNLRLGYLSFGFFCLGISLWALVSLTLMPIELTALPIRVRVNQYSGSGLQALGTTYLKMALAISLSFMAVVIVAILAPMETNIVILIWLGGAALMIFGFFLLPQVGIHRVMVREKSNRMEGFSKHLEEAMEVTLQNPSSENMQRLRELFEVQNHLRSMNEWPFNLASVWQLLTALVIPVMVALAEFMFKP